MVMSKLRCRVPREHRMGQLLRAAAWGHVSPGKRFCELEVPGKARLKVARVVLDHRKAAAMSGAKTMGLGTSQGPTIRRWGTSKR